MYLQNGYCVKKTRNSKQVEESNTAINTGFPNYFGLKKPWWPNS